MSVVRKPPIVISLDVVPFRLLLSAEIPHELCCHCLVEYFDRANTKLLNLLISHNIGVDRTFTIFDQIWVILANRTRLCLASVKVTVIRLWQVTVGTLFVVALELGEEFLLVVEAVKPHSTHIGCE